MLEDSERPADGSRAPAAGIETGGAGRAGFGDGPVGVGPWPGGPQAWPRGDDGLADPRYDPRLLADGDARNVVDRYRYWTVEAIVADLDASRHPFHVAIENWGHDFNIGSVVRTANAFGAQGVHIVGRRRWNRRGAMVTDRYQHVTHHADVAALVAWASGAGSGDASAGGETASTEPGATADGGRPGPGAGRLPIVGIDNVPGSIPIEGHPIPRACVLLFGQESSGLTSEALAACDVVLHITQYGSTRSINAGAAAAVAMYAWATRHAGGR